MLPALASHPQDWRVLKRPFAPALAFGACAFAVFAALAVFTALAPPAAADVPTAQIAPELNGVLVDSYLYRTLQTQHQQSATALSSATSLVASSSAELTDLQLDDARLTTEIEAATARKKTGSAPSRSRRT
jgi:hypothetical protein